MKRALLAAFAIVLSASLGSASAAQASPVPGLFQSPVACQPGPRADCDSVIEPKTWQYSQGPGGVLELVNMHWTTWNRIIVAGAQPFNAAVGTGILLVEGNQNQIKAYNVHLQASYPVHYLGHYVFAVVYIIPMSPGAPSWIAASPVVDL